MNYVADTYAQLLKSSIDHITRLGKLENMYSSIYNNISNGKFLRTDFLDSTDDYPKYPHRYNTIDSLRYFNQIKIFNSAMDNTVYLLEGVSEKIQTLKSFYDTIPESDIYLDWALQETYFSNMFKNVYPELFFYYLFEQNDYGNYVFDTFYGTIDENMNDTSLIYDVILYMFLKRNIYNCSDFYAKGMNYLLLIPAVDNSYISNMFNIYIDNNKEDFCKNFLKFIIRYTYGVDDFSDKFLNDLYQNLFSEVLEIKTIFSDHCIDANNILFKIMTLISQTLSMYISTKHLPIILEEVWSNGATGGSFIENLNNIISSSFGLKTQEQEIFNTLQNRDAVDPIKPYLFLNYYYKFFPKKFLNILQLIINQYCNTYIKPDDRKEFESNEISQNIDLIVNNLKFSELISYLTTNITNTNVTSYLTEKDNNEHLIEFGCKLAIADFFDSFFSLTEGYVSTGFPEYIDNIYSSIYYYLKDAGYIDHEYSHFKNRDLSNLYMKSYIKNKIFETNTASLSLTDGTRSIIVKSFQTLGSKGNIDIQINDTGSIIGDICTCVWNESTGTLECEIDQNSTTADTICDELKTFNGETSGRPSIIDDKNTIVTVGGIWNDPVDPHVFTLTGGNSSTLCSTLITKVETDLLYLLSTAPPPGDEITWTFNSAQIESRTKALLAAGKFRMIQFIENIYLTSVTKKIMLENLMYYLA